MKLPLSIAILVALPVSTNTHDMYEIEPIPKASLEEALAFSKDILGISVDMPIPSHAYFVDKEFMRETICTLYNVTSAECYNIRGWTVSEKEAAFLDHTQIHPLSIFVDKDIIADFGGNSFTLQGIVVHEVVHYIQNRTHGHPTTCVEHVDAEKTAYYVQARFLIQYEQPTSFDGVKFLTCP